MCASSESYGETEQLRIAARICDTIGIAQFRILTASTYSKVNIGHFYMNKPIHLKGFNPLKHCMLDNSAEPDQTPQNVASDQVLHCSLTDCPFEI